MPSPYNKKLRVKKKSLHPGSYFVRKGRSSLSPLRPRQALFFKCKAAFTALIGGFLFSQCTSSNTDRTCNYRTCNSLAGAESAASFTDRNKRVKSSAFRTTVCIRCHNYTSFQLRISNSLAFFSSSVIMPICTCCSSFLIVSKLSNFLRASASFASQSA